MNDSRFIPPKLAQRLLNFLIRDDLAEEVAGDLEEKFLHVAKKKSLFKARLNYWYQVLNYLRPFAIRKSRSRNFNHYAMYRNYIKVGYRNLLRNSAHSLINIGGLAVGISVAMIIGIWISEEISVNTNFENHDRVAQVMQHRTVNSITRTQESMPFPIGQELKTKYGSDFKYVVMCSWIGDHILNNNHKKIDPIGRLYGCGSTSPAFPKNDKRDQGRT